MQKDLIALDSIETLIEYVTLFQQENSTIKARKELLVEQRKVLKERIEEMRQILERLDIKIAGYEEIMIKKERQL